METTIAIGHDEFSNRDNDTSMEIHAGNWSNKYVIHRRVERKIRQDSGLVFTINGTEDGNNNVEFLDLESGHKLILIYSFSNFLTKNLYEIPTYLFYLASPAFFQMVTNPPVNW